MKHQIALVARRDGPEAARAYAVQTLNAYRGAAHFRDVHGRRHFAHDPLYRARFVKALCEIRTYLRETRTP